MYFKKGIYVVQIVNFSQASNKHTVYFFSFGKLQ